MKTTFKSLLSSLFILLIFNPCQAQIDIGADLASRYLWRGQLLANGPVIQPSLSFTKNSFEIGFWGSYGIANGFDGTEADLYISNSIGDFTVTLTDYFFPSDGVGPDFDNYFDYSESTTGHVLEAMIGYDSDDVPVRFEVAYDFYGADPDDSYYFNIAYKGIKDTELFLQGGNGWYTFEEANESDGFGIVALGITHSRDIKITESYSLPIFGTVVINPDSEKLMMVFGFSF